VRAALVVVVLCAAAAGARADGGTITGTVRWKGAVPERAPLERASDPVCVRTPRASEEIVVEKARVKDVLVRLAIGSAGTHAAPATPAIVQQDACMYAPRVTGIVAGQAVEIRNGDPTFHNVRGNRGGKVVWNLAQPAGAAPLTRAEVGRPGDVVELHCDVHPWMQAWIVVQDHPYFAVTGVEGAFTIKGVPPGTYTLEAWHPVLGLASTKVKVKKGRTAKATFTLSAPVDSAPR
jgi:plastocyanin